MKYTIRQGMFETNSSSTHSLTLYIDNKDEKGELYEVVEVDDGERREIHTKRMKALLLYQFKFLTLTDAFGPIHDYLSQLTESNLDYNQLVDLERFAKEYRNILEFKDELFSRILPLDEETSKLIEEIETNTPRWNPACLECFCNDVLDFCRCGIDYDTILKRFGVGKETQEEEFRIIDLFLADNVFLLAVEGWYGGAWYEIKGL